MKNKIIVTEAVILPKIYHQINKPFTIEPQTFRKAAQVYFKILHLYNPDDPTDTSSPPAKSAARQRNAKLLPRRLCVSNPESAPSAAGGLNLFTNRVDDETW